MLRPRHLLILLVFSIFIILPLAAQFAGGSGTDADPYLIQTAAQLDSVRYYLSSSFRQIADIDLNIEPYNQGTGWSPISGPGTSYEGFQGKYNGCGLQISNLYINDLSGNPVGFFKTTQGATIDSVDLADVDITGLNNCAGLISNAYNSTISNCHVIGAVNSIGQYVGGLVANTFDNSSIVNCNYTGTLSGHANLGGLVGFNQETDISYCFAQVDISVNPSGDQIGGLIGVNAGENRIDHCYSTGQPITAVNSYGGGLIGGNAAGSEISSCYSTISITGYYYIGGLIGSSNNVDISNCYSTGNVSGYNYFAGFISQVMGSVTNCYSIGSISAQYHYSGFGFIYWGNLLTITSCYWNTETAGTSYGLFAEGRTTDEMTYPYAVNTYVGWDFISMWSADSTGTVNGGYPYLRSMQIGTAVANPVFNPIGGAYNSPVQLTISSATEDALIFYTLDNSEPTELSSLYTSMIIIDTTTTIKARAYNAGLTPSLVSTASYSINVDNEDNLTVQEALTCSVSPNPFSTWTWMNLKLTEDARVEISIFNLKGQLVKNLAGGYYTKGEHQIGWDGSTDAGRMCSAGMYIYMLKAGSSNLKGKLLLIR